jgi:hypothetical protein
MYFIPRDSFASFQQYHKTRKMNLYRLCEDTFIQITIYLMLAVLSSQEEVGISLGLDLHPFQHTKILSQEI